MIVTDGNGYRIRAPRLCRVPDLHEQRCGELAVGQCTVDVSWTVCELHFDLCKNNGFAPLRWAELRARKEAVRAT